MQQYFLYLFFIFSLIWNQSISQKSCNIRSSSCIIIQASDDVVYKFDHTRSFDGSNYEWYFGFEPYTIELILRTPLTHATVQVTLKGYATYDITYVSDLETNPPTYTASLVQATTMPEGLDPASFAAEGKILDLLEGVITMEQTTSDIIIKRNDKTITFSKTSTNTIEPLGLITPPSSFNLPDAYLQLLPETFTIDGTPAPVYTGQAFPVTIIALKFTPEMIQLLYEGIGISIFTYTPSKTQDLFRLESEEEVKPSVTDSTTIHIHDEVILKSFLRTLTEISTQGDRLLLVSEETKELRRLQFGPKLLDIMPTSAPHQMRLEATIYEPGLLKVTTIDNIKSVYTVIYDEVNGKILSVEATDQKTGADAQESEQQKAFNRDLRAAAYFRVDDAEKTITFESASRATLEVYTIDWLSHIKAVEQKYTMVRDSFRRHSFSDQFFTIHSDILAIALTMYETHPGILKAKFSISKHRLPYSYVFQVKDGWVLKIVKEFDAIRGDSPVEDEAIQSLTYILDGVQQISFDGPELIQFIRDYGASRVSFTKSFGGSTSRRSMAAVETLKATVSVDKFVEKQNLVVRVAGGRITRKYDLILYPSTDTVRTVIISTERQGGNYGSSYSERDVAALESIIKTAETVTATASNGNTIISVNSKTKETLEITIRNTDQRTQSLTTDLHPNVGVRVTYNLLPQTFQEDNKIKNFFGTNTAFAIPIKVHKTKLGQIKVSLDLYKSTTYTIDYQDADGWVKSSSYVIGRTIYDSSYYSDLFDKLHKILSQVQQLAFEKDGTLQFIGVDAKDRVAFKSEEPEDQLISESTSESLSVTSYRILNADTQSDYSKNEQYCKINIFEVNVVKFQCVYPRSTMGSRVSVFYIFFSTPSYYVTQTRTFPASGLESNLLTQTVRQAKQIRIHSNELHIVGNEFTAVIRAISSHVNFIRHDRYYDIPVSLSFRLITDSQRRSLAELVSASGNSGDAAKPGFYFASSYTMSNSGFSAQQVDVKIEQLAAGKIQMTVDTGSTLSSYIIKLDYDGRISYVEVVYGQETGSATSLPPTDPLHKFIKDLYSVESTPQGIKFVSKSQQQLIFMEHTAGKYTVLPQTYFKHGSFESLFSRVVEYPLTMTVSQNHQNQAKITLYGKKIHSFIIRFQHHDGWVTDRKFVGSLPIADSNGIAQQVEEYEMIPEQRIVSILRDVQQLAFEADGTLQLITDHGQTRVSFKQTATTIEQVYDTPTYKLGTKTLKPETFMVKHQPTALPTPTEPFSIDVKQAYDGAILVDFTGVNKHSFIYEYQHYDGWVEWQTELEKSNRIIFYDNNDSFVEKQILTILTDVQQIAFETDGRIQFIKDNGGTRVTFQ